MQTEHEYKIWRWLPYLVYGLGSLAILSPLLRPGYYLSLDLVFTPRLNYTDYFWGLSEWSSSVYAANTASTWFFLVLQGAAKIIPAWLVEDLLLFLLFFLAGLGAHRLFSRNRWGAYFAGLLYMVNPFTYTRFLAGQWGVLWAYALIPFAIKAFLELLQTANLKNAVKVAFLSTLVGAAHLPGFFLLFLAFFFILLGKVIKEHRQPRALKSLGQSLSFSALMFVGLNIYWLIPFFTDGANMLGQLNEADLLAFAPRAISSFGVAFDTAAMYGFWRVRYLYAKDFIAVWWLLYLFVLLLASYGFVSGCKDKQQRWWLIPFGAIGIVSYPLALGASVAATKPWFEWLWEHLFWFQGFRDSQKFVALLCLAYACLGGVAVGELAKKLKRQARRRGRVGMIALIAVALITPPAYSFTQFGFHGQIGVTDYPKEWYEVNTYLNQDRSDFNVLFLPWHLYLDFSWLPNREKRLANPSRQFFDKPVIAGDNIEVAGIYSQSTNPVSKYIDFLLTKAGDVDNLGELLAPLNVKYVILVNEADYQHYDFLYHQNDLKAEMERPGITLFKNEHATGRAYTTNSVIYVGSLQEYLDLSRQQDVTEYIYIIGNSTGNDSASQMEVVGLSEKSPVSYTIDKSSFKYTVFTLPQNVSTENWTYNGQKPVALNLGIMPVFASGGGGGQVVYTRFQQVYLPAYLISLLTLGLMAFLYFRFYRRQHVVTKPDTKE